MSTPLKFLPDDEPIVMFTSLAQRFVALWEERIWSGAEVACIERAQALNRERERLLFSFIQAAHAADTFNEDWQEEAAEEIAQFSIKRAIKAAFGTPIGIVLSILRPFSVRGRC